jgi:hypothetical protein
MQARILKLLTRMQQAGPDCNSLVCFEKRSGIENFNPFMLPLHFCHSKFLTNNALQEKHIEALTVNIVHL